MITLTYGRQKPENGDRGSVFWDALAANIVTNDAHDHDGSNSPKISSANISHSTQAIASGSWVAQGNGEYKQTVAMPGAITYDDSLIQFKNTTTGHQYHLTVEKVSANSYDVYINDNTVSLTAIYG